MKYACVTVLQGSIDDWEKWLPKVKEHCAHVVAWNPGNPELREWAEAHGVMIIEDFSLECEGMYTSMDGRVIQSCVNIAREKIDVDAWMHLYPSETLLGDFHLGDNDLVAARLWRKRTDADGKY